MRQNVLPIRPLLPPVAFRVAPLKVGRSKFRPITYFGDWAMLASVTGL